MNRFFSSSQPCFLKAAKQKKKIAYNSNWLGYPILLATIQEVIQKEKSKENNFCLVIIAVNLQCPMNFCVKVLFNLICISFLKTIIKKKVLRLCLCALKEFLRVCFQKRQSRSHRKSTKETGFLLEQLLQHQQILQV